MAEKMTAAHDYFADCAENFVSYLFAHAGFEVYGSGKWEADVVIRDKKDKRWLRIEVRSTDRDKTPLKKSASKLAGKAELYAEVRLKKDNQISYKIWFLTDKGMKVGKPAENYSIEELKKFIADGP